MDGGLTILTSSLVNMTFNACGEILVVMVYMLLYCCTFMYLNFYFILVISFNLWSHLYLWTHWTFKPFKFSIKWWSTTCAIFIACVVMYNLGCYIDCSHVLETFSWIECFRPIWNINIGKQVNFKVLKFDNCRNVHYSKTITFAMVALV